VIEKRPRKLQILGFEYTIEYHASLSDVTHDGRDMAWGTCDYQTATIRIFDDGERPDAEVWHTIWHEVCHAIFSICGRTFAGKEKPDEEVVVDQVASGIVSVIRNNPKVFG